MANSSVFTLCKSRRSIYDFCKYDSRPSLGIPHDFKDKEKVRAAGEADKELNYRQRDREGKWPELDKEDVPYENREKE